MTAFAQQQRRMIARGWAFPPLEVAGTIGTRAAAENGGLGRADREERRGSIGHSSSEVEVSALSGLPGRLLQRRSRRRSDQPSLGIGWSLHVD